MILKNFQFSFVWHLGKPLVLLLRRQHNWVEKYRDIENGPNFLFEYIRIVYLSLVYLQVQTNVALKVTNKKCLLMSQSPIHIGDLAKENPTTFQRTMVYFDVI